MQRFNSALPTEISHTQAIRSENILPTLVSEVSLPVDWNLGALEVSIAFACSTAGWITLTTKGSCARARRAFTCSFFHCLPERNSESSTACLDHSLRAEL